MSSSTDLQDKRKKLRSHVDKDEWPQVLYTYKKESELRTAEITETGDTVLHMAVSKGKYMWVVALVSLIVEDKTPKAQTNDVEATVDGASEKNSNVNAILGAKNKKGNTPLHLAASAPKWSVEMCKKIGDKDSSLTAICNNAGETPLFMAAFHGNIEAFLYLHDLYTNNLHGSSNCDAHYKNADNDTILHCAVAGGHIDVAIEILHLYKDHLKEMTLMRNKNGLSPIHLLAANPSAFKSTDLPRRSFVAQLIYRFFKVKEKEQASTMEEFEQERGCVSCLINFMFTCLDCIDYVEESCWAKKIVKKIMYLLFCLVGLPLIRLVSAGYWFQGIRKMKEKHTWSLQLMKKLLQHAFNEDESIITSKSPSQPPSTSPKTEKGNELEYKIVVDPPLMIAAKNGVIEMVENILESFPFMINKVNEEGKNIVLLAAEKRQTKLYQFLCQNEDLDGNIFGEVDKSGNTALHLAAKLGVNLNMQTTTMVEEFKWFEFVKNSVPSELWEKYNNDGKTAEEIFRDSYKEHIASDRKWLNQTSQTCSVASTLVASMAFSNFAGENLDKKNDSSLVALSLSLTSTISFLAILAFRSQSLNFWRYAPFMLQIAILTMFGSIVALWLSLMLHGHSLTAYAILGSPIAILTIISLPIFIGPSLISIFTKVPPPSCNATSAIRYQKALEKGK